MPDPLEELTAAGVSVWLDDRGDSIRPFYTDAHQVLRDIAAVGVDYDDVVSRPEADGITKFESCWALISPEFSDRLRPAPSASQRSNTAASR
jgi:hypothetical protein